MIGGVIKPASSTTTPWNFIKQKKTPHTNVQTQHDIKHKVQNNNGQNGTTTNKLRTEDVTNHGSVIKYSVMFGVQFITKQLFTPNESGWKKF